MRVESLLKNQAQKEFVAIIHGHESITYADWHKQSRNLSEKINEYTQCCQRHIGILLPNSIDFAVSYFACVYAHKIIVPIDVDATSHEIMKIIEFCEIDCLITTTAIFLEKLSRLEQYQYQLNCILVDAGGLAVINRERPYIKKTIDLNPDYNYETPYLILHTSGTTNNPQYVMLSQKNIMSSLQASMALLKITEESSSLIVLPMQYVYCHTSQFLLHVYAGAQIVIADELSTPQYLLTLVQNYGITNFASVPSLLIGLADYKGSSSFDLLSLEFICFGGGMMQSEILKRLMHRYSSVKFLQGYGLTECSSRVTLSPEDSVHSKFGSVGKPVPGVTVNILDPNGKTLAPGETGEIVVSGNNVMVGYFKQDDETKKVLADQRFYTGDVGYLDADGFLYLCGRKKNIIIRGGKNIFPEEIETILLLHPRIHDAYVYKKENQYYGEVPCAKLVAEGDVTKETVIAHCRGYLSEYKIPRIIQFVQMIQKTCNGKVKRENEWIRAL